MENETQTQSLTNLVGLVFARIDAGILDEYEVSAITEMITEQLGVDVVEQLRAIARLAQMHDNHKDATELYPLAKEWARIVRETAKERGDEQKPEGSKSIPSAIMEAIMEALSEALG